MAIPSIPRVPISPGEQSIISGPLSHVKIEVTATEGKFTYNNKTYKVTVSKGNSALAITDSKIWENIAQKVILMLHEHQLLEKDKGDLGEKAEILKEKITLFNPARVLDQKETGKQKFQELTDYIEGMIPQKIAQANSLSTSPASIPKPISPSLSGNSSELLEAAERPVHSSLVPSLSPPPAASGSSKQEFPKVKQSGGKKRPSKKAFISHSHLLDFQLTEYIKKTNSPQPIVGNKKVLDSLLLRAPIGKPIVCKTAENPSKYYFGLRMSTFQTLIREIKPGEDLFKKVDQYSTKEEFLDELMEKSKNFRLVETQIQEGPLGCYNFFINKDREVFFKQKMGIGTNSASMILEKVDSDRFFEHIQELTSEKAQREGLNDYFVADIATAESRLAQDRLGAFRLFDASDKQSILIAVKLPRNEVGVFSITDKNRLIESVAEHLSPIGKFESLKSYHAKDKKEANAKLKNLNVGAYLIWKEDDRPDFIKFMQKIEDGSLVEKEIPAEMLYEQIEAYKNGLVEIPGIKENHF